MKKSVLFLFIALTFSALSLFATPSTIVFDFGGVMTGTLDREAVPHFLCKTFQLSDTEFEEIFQEKQAALQKGEIEEAFWLSFAKKKGISLPANWIKSFHLVIKDAMKINPQMFLLIEELKKQKISVGLLSNINELPARVIQEFGFYAPFKPCLLSYETGFRKPDPKAFELLLKKLALPAKEVLFIDDLKENIEEAKKLGIDAILFTSEDALRKELRQRGVKITLGLSHSLENLSANACQRSSE